MVLHRWGIAALVVVTIGCLSVDRAVAQTPALFGAGLSFISDEGTGAGFAVNVSKDLISGPVGLGPVGDFSLHHDNGTWTTFGGGVRVTGHPAEAKVTPFGQFLVGASSISFGGNDTFLTFIYGGGVHVPLGDRLNFLFQFDLVNLRSDFGSTTGKRTTLGISIPLGSQ